MTAATSRWSVPARRTVVVLAVIALGAWAGPASAGDGNGNGNDNGNPPPQAGPLADPGNGNGNGNGGGTGGEQGNAVGNPHGPQLDTTGDAVAAPEETAPAADAPEVTEPEPELVEKGEAEDPQAPTDVEVPASEPDVAPAPETVAPPPPPPPAPEPKPKPQAQQPPAAAARPAAPAAQPEPPRALPSTAPRWTSPVPVAVTTKQGVLGRFASAGSDVDVVRGVNGAHGVRVVGNADGRFSLTTASPILAGRTPYRAAAWLRTDTPGVTVCLRVMEKTSGRKSRLVRSAETCISPTATWQRFRVQALAIAPGNVLRISAVVYGAFEGASFELSRLKVERKVAGRWTKVRAAIDRNAR
jgi:hypothetical protein